MATIVIHSRTKERISCTYGYEWSMHVGHRLRDGSLIMKSRLIDKKKAQEIIEKEGLVECHRTADGEVYDTKFGNFKEMFPRGYSREDEKVIDKIDNL